MKQKVFLSFHYDRDAWRVQQVKNMGVVEEQPLLSSNDWEAVKKKGEQAIKDWIAKEMKGKNCVVVLIGTQTAGRKWVNYEIEKGWKDGKGVVGVRIHKLKQANELPSAKGGNPFNYVTLPGSTKKLSTVAEIYDPAGATSNEVYSSIKKWLPTWVEKANKIRADHK